MKLLPQEQKRLRHLGLVQTKLSPDNRADVTEKSLVEFAKEVHTLLRNRRKHLYLVCLEIDKGEDQ